MSLLNLKKFGFLVASMGLCALVALQGCSSDDNQATPGTGGKNSSAGAAGSNKAGSGSKAGSGNGGSSGQEDEPSEGGAAGGSGEGEGGAGGEASVDPGCLGEDDCYKCEPKTNSQFLNACVEGGCPASFDNSTLPKLNLVGTL